MKTIVQSSSLYPLFHSDDLVIELSQVFGEVTAAVIIEDEMGFSLSEPYGFITNQNSIINYFDVSVELSNLTGEIEFATPVIRYRLESLDISFSSLSGDVRTAVLQYLNWNTENVYHSLSAINGVISS